MTVIADCTDKVEDGGANATPYEYADDGADGGTRGGGGNGEDEGGDGSEDGSGGADGITSRDVSVVIASTPLHLLGETHLEAQESGSNSR